MMKSQSTSLAVLLQSIEDYYRYRDAVDAEGRARFAALAAWFAADDSENPEGFETLCKRVQLSADFIREMLRNHPGAPRV